MDEQEDRPQAFAGGGRAENVERLAAFFVIDQVERRTLHGARGLRQGAVAPHFALEAFRRDARAGIVVAVETRARKTGFGAQRLQRRDRLPAHARKARTVSATARGCSSVGKWVLPSSLLGTNHGWFAAKSRCACR